MTDGKPVRKYLRGLGQIFVNDVDWRPRVGLALGFMVVAFNADSSGWFLLYLVTLWIAIAQLALAGTYNQGWLDGAKWVDELNEQQSTIAMGDLLDLCDRHGVPPQEVAQLIWKSQG